MKVNKLKSKKEFKYENLSSIQIISDCHFTYFYSGFDKKFVAFYSNDNTLYIIYQNKDNSIIAYNLIDNKKIIEIKNAHSKEICTFKHYFDNNNKRDLVISVSAKDNNIKLWNVSNWECLLNLKNINKSSYLTSANFFIDKKKIYIITSGYVGEIGIADPIQVFNLKGKKIKEIKKSLRDTHTVDGYYDVKLLKNYIITCNLDEAVSYDYYNNKLYKVYSKAKEDYYCVVVVRDGDIVKLLGSAPSYIYMEFSFSKIIK